VKNYFLRGAAFLAAAAFLFVLLNPTPVKADEWDLATIFSVSHQVEIPGDKVLQPNTKYLIRLLDSPANRTVVQVFNKDRTHLISMFMAIPAIRPEPTDHTVFEFMEVPAGYPVPIRAWFYPGRKTGLEFMYPKEEREKFASYTAKPVKTSVETTQAVVVEQPTEPVHNEVAQNQPVEAAPPVNEADIAKAEPPTQEIERSKPTEPEQGVTQAPTPEPQEQSTTSQTPKELPHTSGALGLLALTGALSAAAGLGSRRLRKK
jgi:hypothetical protein